MPPKLAPAEAALQGEERARGTAEYRILLNRGAAIER